MKSETITVFRVPPEHFLSFSSLGFYSRSAGTIVLAIRHVAALPRRDNVINIWGRPSAAHPTPTPQIASQYDSPAEKRGHIPYLALLQEADSGNAAQASLRFGHFGVQARRRP